MKIEMTLKLALFAFLSAIVCTIGNSVLGLAILEYAETILMFFAYLSVTIWVCQLVNKKSSIGKTLIVSIFSFALAVYFGVLMSISNNEVVLMFASCGLYLFAIICLVSVIILIGRIVFGKKGNEDTKIPQTAELRAQWVCKCGAKNVGNFCAECGSAMPETEDTEAKKAEGE